MHDAIICVLTRTRRLRRIRRGERVPLHQLLDAHVLLRQGGRVDRRRALPDHRRRGGKEDSQLPGLVLLLGLLASEGDLGRHHPLSFRDEGALGAVAVAPPAVPLVALEGRDDAVVAAPGALGGALVALGRPQEERRGDGAQDRVLGHEGGHVHAAAGDAHVDGLEDERTLSDSV